MQEKNQLIIEFKKVKYVGNNLIRSVQTSMSKSEHQSTLNIKNTVSNIYNGSSP